MLNDRQGLFQGTHGGCPGRIDPRQNHHVGQRGQRLQKYGKILVLHHPDHQDETTLLFFGKTRLQMDFETVRRSRVMGSITEDFRMTPKSFEPARPGNLRQALPDGLFGNPDPGHHAGFEKGDGTGRIHRLMLAVQRAVQIHVLAMQPDEIEGTGRPGDTLKLAAESERPCLLLSRLLLQDAGDRRINRPHDQRNVPFDNSRFLKGNRFQG